jgi:hypothetical protein
MHADLKDVSFIDEVFNHEGRFETSDPTNVPMHASIGIKGRDGGDLFIFKACNSAWVIRNAEGRPCLITKAVICDCRTQAEIREYLGSIISKIHGSQWSEIVSKIEVMADWEFAK